MPQILYIVVQPLSVAKTKRRRRAENRLSNHRISCGEDKQKPQGWKSLGVSIWREVMKFRLPVYRTVEVSNDKHALLCANGWFFCPSFDNWRRRDSLCRPFGPEELARISLKTLQVLIDKELIDPGST